MKLVSIEGTCVLNQTQYIHIVSPYQVHKGGFIMNFSRIFNSSGILSLLLLISNQAYAFHTETHFDDTVKHKVVYQLNKADTDYIDSVLFSAGELLRKYGDDVHIVITVIGPGIHLLAKQPLRSIKPFHTSRVKSLASYGVHFQACGNTLKSLKWTMDDLHEEAEYVEIGADSLMTLQAKGYSYISW